MAPDSLHINPKHPRCVMGFFVGSKLAQSAESQINAGMLQSVLSCGPEELDACMLDFESVGLTGAQNGVKLGG